MVSDKPIYEKLKDPTRKYKPELISMLSTLEKDVKIIKYQYWYFYPTLEKIPWMYNGTPKILKEGIPLDNTVYDMEDVEQNTIATAAR